MSAHYTQKVDDYIAYDIPLRNTRNSEVLWSTSGKKAARRCPQYIHFIILQDRLSTRFSYFNCFLHIVKLKLTVSLVHGIFTCPSSKFELAIILK